MKPKTTNDSPKKEKKKTKISRVKKPGLTHDIPSSKIPRNLTYMGLFPEHGLYWSCMW